MASNYPYETGEAARDQPALKWECCPGGAQACAVAAPDITNDLALQLEQLALSAPPQLQQGPVMTGVLFNCGTRYEYLVAFVTVQGHLAAGRGILTAGEQVIGECFFVPADSPALTGDPLAAGTRASAILSQVDPPCQEVGQLLLTTFPNARLMKLQFSGGAAILRCQLT